MSYIVLARKWRPQSFDDLTGQETVATTFINAIKRDKIVHAYLFSGPRGVGKTSTARILSKALNCTARQEGEPCGKCDNCKAITAGSYVDVFEIDGASNTGVDDVRELREAVKYAPSSGKYKVYIIDEVHMLSTQAFNALLKTLEEPPPHVIFIFATTEPKKIPATILSRCQHHSFRKIPKEKIKGQLKKIIEAEGINIQDMPLDMIARAADGSMRDALTLLDQASSFSENVTEKDLQVLLGLPETEMIKSLSAAILGGDINKTLTIIKDQADRGYDLRTLTRELLEHFRNLAIIKAAEDADSLLDFSAEETEEMRRECCNVGIEPLTLILNELLRLDGEVRSALNPRYILELGLLKISFVKGMTSINEVLKALEKADGGEVKEEKPSAEKKKAEAQPLTIEDAGQVPDVCAPEAGKAEVFEKESLWNSLVAHFDIQDHLLACKLAEAKAVELTERELVIGFNGGMSLLSDSITQNARAIEDILKKLSGRRLRLKIIPLPSKKTEQAQGISKEKLMAEPLIQSAIKILNSSILEVRALEKNGNSSESQK
ncbi:MAG: DNA polymerase III subunit gamma/tau [Nitrospirae bacterium]|nr:DNA polymerase III subunit gamma/tau [Nitrospirota bacterium]